MSIDTMTADLLGDVRIQPGRMLSATLVATLATTDRDDFETTPTAALKLSLEGIAGDRHAGFTRRSGGREPWYPRGTEMRSGRQLSLVSVEELKEIANAMRIDMVEPGWIGANLVLSGLTRLSYLPTGTRLTFEGGAVIVVENQNAPCRFAGKAIGRHAGMPGAEFSFPKVAKRLRGVVATVERAGEARAGEVVIKIPEQWIY